jgi:hypothetical protein
VSNECLYQHVKRPEWGLSTIIGLQDDRTTFLFVDGTQRTFKRDHLHMMELVTAMDEATEEAYRKLATYTRSATTGAIVKVRAPAKKKPKVPKVAKVVEAKVVEAKAAG